MSRIGDRFYSVKKLANYAIDRPFVFPVGFYVALIFIQELIAKYTIHRNLLVLSILVIGFRVMRDGRTPSLESLMFLAYGILACLSISWNIFGDDKFSVSALFFIVLFCFLLANYEFSQQDVDDLANLLLVGGVLASLYVYYRYFTGQGYYVNYRLTIGDAQNSEDPNTFAAFLTLGVGAALRGLMDGKSNLSRVAYGGMAVIVSGVILMTGSRGGALGLAIVFAVFLFGSPIKVGTKIVIVLFGLMIAPTLPGFDLIMERFDEKDLAEGSGRTYIWEVAIQRFQEKAFFGHGAESFQHLYYEVGNSGGKVVHSSPLTALVEQGLIGFGFLMVGTGLAMFYGLKNLRGKAASWLLAVSISFSVQVLFLSLLYSKPFWLVWGVFAGVARSRLGVRQKSSKRTYYYDGSVRQRNTQRPNLEVGSG